MYIAINNDNVFMYKTLKKLNKKLGTELTNYDFVKKNNNYIINIENDDLDYQRDINQLERVFVNKLFKKDLTPLITYGLLVVVMLLQVINLTTIGGVNDTILTLIESLNKVVLP